MTQVTDNNVKWLIRIGGGLFIATLGLIGLAVNVIYGAGMVTERLKNHIKIEEKIHTRIDADFIKQLEATRELQMLINTHILVDKVGLNIGLEKKRKDWEEKQPPIYAVNGGEEA